MPDALRFTLGLVLLAIGALIIFGSPKRIARFAEIAPFWGSDLHDRLACDPLLQP